MESRSIKFIIALSSGIVIGSISTIIWYSAFVDSQYSNQLLKPANESETKVFVEAANILGESHIDSKTHQKYIDALINKLITNNETDAISKLVINGHLASASNSAKDKVIAYLNPNKDGNSIEAVLTYYEQYGWTNTEQILNYLSAIAPDNYITILRFLYQDRPHIFGILSDFIIANNLQKEALHTLKSHMPAHRLILLTRQSDIFTTQDSQDNSLSSFRALLNDMTCGRKPADGMLSYPIKYTVVGNKCREFSNYHLRMMKYEVTNEQYYTFIKRNNIWSKKNISSIYHDGNYLRHWEKDAPPTGKELHPVTYVSWNAANAYCRWRGGQLPTKEDWMSSAGCSDGKELKIYPWGDVYSDDKCNVGFKIGGTVLVGYYPGVSDSGLYDMCGNVWEWTSSKKGNFYILKGSSWGGYTEDDAKIANEYLSLGERTGNHIGFRCAWNTTW